MTESNRSLALQLVAGLLIILLVVVAFPLVGAPR